MDGILVARSQKVAFYGITGESSTITYHRMTGFTDMSTSKNPKEYSRQYVDEAFEQTDITGYSPSISYSFDQYKGNAVHDDLVQITDNELMGNEAIRGIILVDMSKTGTAANSFVAVQRSFSVIPDSEGGSLDAYTYSGNLKVKGEKVFGTAVSSDGWKTCTFTDEEDPEATSFE